MLSKQKTWKLTIFLKLDRFWFVGDRKFSSFQLQVERLRGESKHAQGKVVVAVVSAVEGEVLKQRSHQRVSDVLHHLVAHAGSAPH